MNTEDRLGELEKRVIVAETKTRELIAQTEAERDKLKLDASQLAEEVTNLKLTLEKAETFKKSFLAFLGEIPQLSQPAGQRIINLETTQTNVHVTTTMQEVKADDKSTRGRILFLATKGFFKTQRELKDVVEGLMAEGWTEDRANVGSRLSELAADAILGKKVMSGHTFYFQTDRVTFTK